MAIGIPGISVGAPLFITGEPRREYLFKFVLTSANHTNLGRTPAWVSLLLSNLFLVYISSLAEQVNLPPSKIMVGNVNVNTLQGYPYPKGFETPTFSVVYLEDELESVFRFHKVWQDNIRGTDGIGAGGTGLQFEPLGNICCKALYSPTKKISIPITDTFALGEEIPLGADVFPYVFPSEVQRSPANKGGQGIAKTTVVYTRVPDIRGWNKSIRRDTRVSTSTVAHQNSHLSNIRR